MPQSGLHPGDWSDPGDWGFNGWTHVQRERAGVAMRFLTGLLVAVLLGLAILGLGGLAWQQRYATRVIPGVWVAGIPLQDLTLPEAEEALRRGWGEVGPRHLTLRDGDRQWVVPLEELGITWDVAATARAAMALGHTGSFANDWLARLRGLRNGVTVAPVWSFDEGRANVTLRGLASEIDRQPRSATLNLEGPLPRSEPATAGRELDVAATRWRLGQVLTSGLPQSLDLAIRPLAPTVADAEGARKRAEELLARQVTVVYDEGPEHYAWSLDRQVIARCLTSRQEAGSDGLTRWVVDFQPDPIREWVANIARQIDRDPLEGRVQVDPATLRASMRIPSQTGRKVNVGEALTRVLAALESGTPTVELPVEVVRPYASAESVAQWSKLTLLSEGVSNFKGSDAGRRQNILTGASRFQGVVVPPGETFSFNRYLGLITLAEGWSEAYVIMGDRTELGAGGGICQVATTAFRAAFFGGFPIVQRYPHPYRVAWYEPPVGLDATVFTPSVDLKFRNDLSIPIVILTEADPTDGRLVFRFYGPGSLGRTVEMEGPTIDRESKAPPPIYEDDPSLAPGQVVLMEAAHDGLRATIYRIIKQGDQITREKFVSEYEPWPARYKRGPQR